MTTSPLAQGDLDDLRAEGLKPTDEDVIRLHALACRITASGETNAYTAPRWATAGGVVFYEPTMAARFWYAYAKRYADDPATEDWLFAYACAHGREKKRLDELHDPDEINRALGFFISGITATKEEVDRAVYYVAVGFGDVEAEKTELAKQIERESEAHADREQRNYAALEEIMAQAAAATGLTFDDLMISTPSRLRGMIYAAHVQAGMVMPKTDAKAHADYLATLSAIEKRLRAEKDAEAAAEAASAEEPPPAD